jgi:hypothetical protein
MHEVRASEHAAPGVCVIVGSGSMFNLQPRLALPDVSQPIPMFHKTCQASSACRSRCLNVSTFPLCQMEPDVLCESAIRWNAGRGISMSVEGERSSISPLPCGHMLIRRPEGLASEHGANHIRKVSSHGTL